MPDLITIRNAEVHEATELSRLAIRSKAYWGYTRAFMQACREELTVTADEIDSPDTHYVVAEFESTIAGFCALGPISDFKCELEAMFVDPEYIGRGVGRTLMKYASKTAKAMGATKLIIQSDPNAEKFYRAAGGELIGNCESASFPGRLLPLFSVDLVREDAV